MTTKLKMVQEFFEMSDEEFKREWAELATRDKLQLVKGIATDGSLTY